MENWNNDTHIYNTDKEVNLEEASKGKSWISIYRVHVWKRLKSNNNVTR